MSLQTALRWLATVVLTLPALGAQAGTVAAPDASRGRSLYNAVIVPGQPSCANGACHGPSPTLRQNRIHLGTTVADLDYAIKRVYSMGFLNGTLGERALADLAAYIANAETEDERVAVEIRLGRVDVGAVRLSAPIGERFAVAIRNTGARPVTLSAIAVEGDGFFADGGCDPGTRLLPGNACKLHVRFQPFRPGESVGRVRVSHGPPAASVEGHVVGRGVPADAPARPRMVEYVHAPLDYYFQIARAEEQRALDALADFERTGASHATLEPSDSDAVALVRFYFDRIARFGQRGSHFHSAAREEQALLRGLNPGNLALPRIPVDEGVVAWVRLPDLDATGQRTCPAPLRPVYRLFRGPRYPDDANHRFTGSTALYAQFVNEGWDGEGVAYCVPGG
jgi:hypothetical protein